MKKNEDDEMDFLGDSSTSVSEPDEDELLPRKGQAKGKPATKKPRASSGSSKAPANVERDDEEKEKSPVNGKGRVKKSHRRNSRSFSFVTHRLTFSDVFLAGQLLKRPN